MVLGGQEIGRRKARSDKQQSTASEFRKRSSELFSSPSKEVVREKPREAFIHGSNETLPLEWKMSNWGWAFSTVYFWLGEWSVYLQLVQLRSQNASDAVVARVPYAVFSPRVLHVCAFNCVTSDCQTKYHGLGWFRKQKFIPFGSCKVQNSDVCKVGFTLRHLMLVCKGQAFHGTLFGSAKKANDVFRV